jgi:hypothetical protein
VAAPPPGGTTPRLSAFRLGGRCLVQDQMVKPPSTFTVAAVRWRASGQARNATAAATSAGLGVVPEGGQLSDLPGGRAAPADTSRRCRPGSLVGRTPRRPVDRRNYRGRVGAVRSHHGGPPARFSDLRGHLVGAPQILPAAHHRVGAVRRQSLGERCPDAPRAVPSCRQAGNSWLRARRRMALAAGGDRTSRSAHGRGSGRARA